MSVKYISGPTSIVRMKSDMYDKDIYLMGDNHKDLSDICFKNEYTVEIYDFLNDFFLKSDKDKIYDFFLEVGFFGKSDNYSKQNSYLYKIIDYFQKKNCFYIDKSKQKKCHKKYSNVRFHISDARKNDINFKLEYSPLIFGIIYIHSLFSVKNIVYDNSIHFQNFNAFISTYKYKKNFKKLYTDLWDIKLIKIQYEKIKNKKIKRVIKKYFSELYKTLCSGNLFDYVLKINKDLSSKKIMKADFLKYLSDKKIYSFLTKISALYMDLYLILRLFKDFDIDKSFKKIIIYAGDFHISTYIKLLKILDFKIIEKSNSIKLRCQDISKMNEFFN